MRTPTRKIPRANKIRLAMMKIPTARYRLDIPSLRNEFASDFVVALTYLVYRPEGDKISFVEHADPVSYPAGPVHIMCDDDQSRPVFCLAPHEQLIDLRGGDTIQATARLIGQQNLRFKHQRSGEACPLLHASRERGRIFRTICSQSDIGKNTVDQVVNLVLGFFCQSSEW